MSHSRLSFQLSLSITVTSDISVPVAGPHASDSSVENPHKIKERKRLFEGLRSLSSPLMDLSQTDFFKIYLFNVLCMFSMCIHWTPMECVVQLDHRDFPDVLSRAWEPLEKVRQVSSHHRCAQFAKSGSLVHPG